MSFIPNDYLIETNGEVHIHTTGSDPFHRDIVLRTDDPSATIHLFAGPFGGVEAHAFLNMNGNRIVGVPTPFDPNEAANKAYVDSMVAGITVNGGSGISVAGNTVTVNALPTTFAYDGLGRLALAQTVAGTGMTLAFGQLGVTIGAGLTANGHIAVMAGSGLTATVAGGVDINPAIAGTGLTYNTATGQMAVDLSGITVDLGPGLDIYSDVNNAYLDVQAATGLHVYASGVTQDRMFIHSDLPLIEYFGGVEDKIRLAAVTSFTDPVAVLGVTAMAGAHSLAYPGFAGVLHVKVVVVGSDTMFGGTNSLALRFEFVVVSDGMGWVTTSASNKNVVYRQNAMGWDANVFAPPGGYPYIDIQVAQPAILLAPQANWQAIACITKVSPTLMQG